MSEEPSRDAQRPLRVGLNLAFLGERAGGAGRYAIELPGALLAAEPDTQVHVFVSRDAPRELREQPWAQSVRWIRLPVGVGGSANLLAQFALLPPRALGKRLDVLHSPANTGPVLTPGVASVVSLLDLIWLHRASEWEPEQRASRTMERLVRYCVKRASLIFAISEAAAEDFVATLGIARERIEVTPLGVHPHEHAASPLAEQALRERLQLGAARVVLCVAQKRPYKNLHSLVRALPELDDDVVLVLPGSPTPYESELRSLAEQLGVADRLRLPDWLSQSELDAAFAISSVFVLPSLIEGFGIPVLEAMSRGVPVACSNVSALPEVAGDAALLFDPQRQDEVTGAVRRLLEDRELAARLIARGHERVAHYSWRRTGASSLAGYRRAIDARL